ncbi:MAG: DUF3426 domain-containing protein [Xanthomonadaceae bacterium]|nr:DUF3426 domain-containing protein [Xanthomonadaceae bacterium]
MLTQSPNCQTIFRVTSEILRVADGQVRCGRCQRQFDALERLIEEDEGEIESSRPRSAMSAPPSSEHIEVEEPPTHEDITMEGRHIEISGTYRVPDRYGNGADELEEKTVEEWVEIDEEDPFPLSGDTNVERDKVDDEIEADSDSQLETDLDEEVVDEALADEQFAAHRTTSTRATGSPRFAYGRSAPMDDASPDIELLAPPTQRASHSKIWSYLVAPLALLLIAQWVHNYRATLARHPTIGEPLQSLYRTIGIPLTPNWDLHAYQIRQWGVISDPSSPGTLRVRASITNLAEFAQPYPLLKLVLEDRWGEQIRAREFEPTEYLDPTISPNRMLSPGQQTNASIVIVDPGPDAEGFRFDVCLRGSAGTVCAEEVRRRR